MKIAIELTLMIILKITVALGFHVAGRTLTQTILSPVPSLLQTVVQHRPLPHHVIHTPLLGSFQHRPLSHHVIHPPLLGNFLLNKNLLELNCLRDSYNRHHFNNHYHTSKEQTRNFFVGPPQLRYQHGSNVINIPKLQSQHDTHPAEITTLKRRRYGENPNVILPQSTKPSIYYRGHTQPPPQINSFSNRKPLHKVQAFEKPTKKSNSYTRTKNLKKQKTLKATSTTPKAITSTESAIKIVDKQHKMTFLKNKEDEKKNEAMEVPKNTVAIDAPILNSLNSIKKLSKLPFAPIKATSTTSKAITNTESAKKTVDKQHQMTFLKNKEDEKKNEAMEVPKNTVAIDAPILNSLNSIKKLLKLPSAPIKATPLPLPPGKNSTRHSWPSTIPYNFRPYEVKEEIEENIRVDVNGDREGDAFNNGNFNKKKFPGGTGTGTDRIIPKLPVNHQTKPKLDDSLGLLKNSINNILKDLIGDKSKEVTERLGTRQFTNEKMGNVIQLNQSNPQQVTVPKTSPLPPVRKPQILKSYQTPKSRDPKEISESKGDTMERQMNSEMQSSYSSQPTQPTKSSRTTKRSTDFIPYDARSTATYTSSQKLGSYQTAKNRDPKEISEQRSTDFIPYDARSTATYTSSQKLGSYQTAKNRDPKEISEQRSTDFIPYDARSTATYTSAVQDVPTSEKGATTPQNGYHPDEETTSLTTGESTTQTSPEPNFISLLNPTVSLPDLFTYSMNENSDDGKSQTHPPTSSDLTSNYYVQTEEMSLVTSASPERNDDFHEPVTWLLPSLGTTKPDSILLLPDLSTTSLDNAATNLPKLMQIVTILPEEQEETDAEATTTTTTTPSNEGKSITSQFKEFTDDPLTFDLLVTTTKSDSKNSETNWKNGRKMHYDIVSEDDESSKSVTGPRRSDILIKEDASDKSRKASPGYLQVLKQNSSSVIDSLVPSVASVIDDLRRNKIDARDISGLSKAFGKYWPSILNLSKDPNLDMLPLMQMKGEKDLENVLKTFLPENSEKTAEETVDMKLLDDDDDDDDSSYDYMVDYKDLYDDVIDQDLDSDKKRKRKLTIKRNSKSLSKSEERKADDEENAFNRIKRHVMTDDLEELTREAEKEYLADLAEEQRYQTEEENNYLYEDALYNDLPTEKDLMELGLTELDTLNAHQFNSTSEDSKN